MSQRVHPIRLLREADRAERLGAFDEASRHVRAYLELLPRSPAVRTRLAGLLERLGDEQGAIEAWSVAATRYAEDGFLHKAVALWRRVARERPHDPESRERLGELYAALGHLVEARQEFQQAIEVCLRRGLRTRAAQLLAKKLALADDPAERLTLARLDAREGRSDEALDHACRAAELATLQGAEALAREALELALALAPARSDLSLELARLVVAEQPERALALVAPESGETAARLLRAQALLALGRWAEAEASLVNLGSGGGEAAALGLMRARLAQGRSGLALDSVARHLDRLVEQRELEKAAEVLEELLVGDADFVPALLRLAHVHQLAGHHAGLADTYARLALAHHQHGDEELALAAEALAQATRSDPAADARRPAQGLAAGPGTDVEAALERAAATLRAATAVVVTAGVELETAFGAPDLADPESLWNLFPSYREARLEYEELARGELFLSDPALAWGFFGRRRELARARRVHEGLEQLRRWRSLAPAGGYVVTALVEGQFARAGFDPAKIVECRGSLEWLQCARDCGVAPWRAPEASPPLDAASLHALPPYPVCPKCAELARPNVLLPGDWAWSMERVSRQDERLQAWLAQQAERGTELVLIECGETPRLPMLRTYVRRLLRDRTATIVSLGPGPAAGPLDICVRLPLAEALRALDARL